LFFILSVGMGWFLLNVIGVSIGLRLPRAPDRRPGLVGATTGETALPEMIRPCLP
jgi:hypothetical protein